MANQKYKLLENDTIQMGNGATLYRIEALIDFGDVKAGDKGGYIEKEKNVSQYGNAWVSGNAQVYGNARVSGNAQVYGDARVYGDACVYDNAEVYGCARVYGDAGVSGTGRISSLEDLIQISPVGSEEGTFTAYLNKDGDISVTRGCFEGSLRDFQTAVEKTHGNNQYGAEYNLVIGLAKAMLRK